jgi:hypothetical protein
LTNTVFTKIEANSLCWLTGSVLIARTVEAASASETSVNFYETTRRNIPEDILIHTCRRENLKSPSCLLRNPAVKKNQYWLMLRRQKELQKLLHQVHEESSEYYNQFVT